MSNSGTNINYYCGLCGNAPWPCSHYIPTHIAAQPATEGTMLNVLVELREIKELLKKGARFGS